MNILTITLVALVVAGVWIWVRAWRKYAPLFQDAHFREIVDALPALKAAAFGAVGRPIATAGDPRVAQTSAHVTIFYSVEDLEEGGALLNHLSLSRAGESVTWAAGGRFAYVILRQLGIAPRDGAFALGPTGVVHLAFVVPGESRETFRATPVSPLPSDLSFIKEEAGAFMRETLRSGRLLPDEHRLITALLGAD
jgi:hypothetical protein